VGGDVVISNMASFTAVCRLSTRLAKGQFRNTTSRGPSSSLFLLALLDGSIANLKVLSGFQTSSMRQAAHNFAMPAMSPTMTEGNIAKWNVKEGTSTSVEAARAQRRSMACRGKV